MILDIIVVFASLATGDTCAALDNRTNTAVWFGPEAPLTRTHYRDNGDFLIYEVAPRPEEVDAWLAIHYAEEALQEGAPGYKIPVRCVE